jgi:hypothetical protein
MLFSYFYQVSKYFPKEIQRYLGNLNLVSPTDKVLKLSPKIIPAVPSMSLSHGTMVREKLGFCGQICIYEYMHRIFSKNF